MLLQRFHALRRAPNQLAFFSTSLPRLLNPYKALNVDPNASDKEIKKQYYSLAKKYHPDVNKSPGADKKFQEIQNSYEMLNTKEKRQKYDMYGDQQQQGAGGGSPFNSGFGNSGFGNGGFGGFNGFGGSASNGFGGGFSFEDLFTNFGQQTNKRHARTYEGANLEVLVQVSLEDLALNRKKEVKYQRTAECSKCHGSGLKPGFEPKTCGSCHGEGSIAHNMSGFFVQQECPDCHGSGQKIPASCACKECQGQGVKSQETTLSVSIPFGIQNGTRILRRGLGDAAPHVGTSHSGKPGDLYVKVFTLPHKLFSRIGAYDLELKTDISVSTACLGGTIEIPTIYGHKIKVSVPSGTQFQDKIFIEDQGLPKPGNAKGRLLVKLNIKIQRPKTETERMLLEALAMETNDRNARISTGEKDEGMLKRLLHKFKFTNDK